MFSRLSSFVVELNLDLDDALITLISSHLQTLKNEFIRYFPDTSKPEFDLIRNSFLLDRRISIPILDENDDENEETQEELISLIHDSYAILEPNDITISKNCLYCVKTLDSFSIYTSV